MRAFGRTAGAITGTALILGLVATGAVAKTGISLQSQPYGLSAGEAWTPAFQYIHADGPTDLPGRPHVRVRVLSLDSGATHSFPAHRIATGTWTARVVFPSAGRWSYSFLGFGVRVGRQSWDPVTITPRRHTAAAGSAHSARPHIRSESFPVLWTIIGVALSLLVGGVLLARMRRTAQPS
jgi:hypothetical protein